MTATNVGHGRSHHVVFASRAGIQSASRRRDAVIDRRVINDRRLVNHRSGIDHRRLIHHRGRRQVDRLEFDRLAVCGLEGRGLTIDRLAVRVGRVLRARGPNRRRQEEERENCFRL